MRGQQTTLLLNDQAVKRIESKGIIDGSLVLRKKFGSVEVCCCINLCAHNDFSVLQIF